MIKERVSALRRSLGPVDDTAADRPSPDIAPQRSVLPLFPLDTALLPGAHLPLHIVEPRYRQLMVDLMNASEDDREFGIVTSKAPIGSEITSAEQAHRIGCSARLREVQRLSGGEFDIVTTGHRPFRLLHIDHKAAPYLIGTVEWIHDDPVRGQAANVAAILSDLARDAHRRYCDFAWDTDWTPPPAETELGILAYALAADCLLPHDDRQRLLAETHPVRRLQMARKVLSRETGLLAQLNAVPAPLSGLLDVQDQANLN